MKNRSRLLRILEITLLAVTLLLLGAYAVGNFDRWIYGRTALREFELGRARAGATPSSDSPQGFWPAKVDFSLWSEKRVRAYRESVTGRPDGPLAVLTVPGLGIRAPVVQGTDELALNRGLGWIQGTARPGRGGNVGIAGHRDGFFRALKDIRLGDDIRLETTTEVLRYNVDRLEIVTPDDVGVLADRGVDALTLVTCYPFYFVGDAPQRFIVHAARKQDERHNR